MMMKKMMAAVACAAFVAAVAPQLAEAGNHKAVREGVLATANGTRVGVLKTSDDGKGAFAHYRTANTRDKVTPVINVYQQSMGFDTFSDVRGVTACISNGWLPSTCSRENSEY